MSYLINAVPGKTNTLLSSFNIMSVPNMDTREKDDFLMEDFNIQNLLFSSKEMDP